MRYRIEVSIARKGFVQVHFPGRLIALEASRHEGLVWQVEVTDDGGGYRGLVSVHAENAADAAWRVAQATVRAVSGLMQAPLDPEPTDSSNHLARG
ncbi:MAG: hypothetical protein JO001_13465 [Alphaproteobacteria bacterium]|nr:hypothetical protein [Alphaproteobacteria bacterium]